MNKYFLNEWLEKRYAEMWHAFGVTSFSFEDAFELLEKKFNDNKTLVEVILSELQKEGWLRLEVEYCMRALTFA